MLLKQNMLYLKYIRRLFIRVLSKEYKEHLKHNEVYQFIMSQPRPDFKELDKESKEFEDWISTVHKEEQKQLQEMSKK